MENDNKHISGSLDRYGVYEAEDGPVVFFDRTNPDAWLRSDLTLEDIS